jgi:hypothetical protein
VILKLKTGDMETVEQTNRDTNMSAPPSPVLTWLHAKVTLLNKAFNSLSIVIQRRIMITCGMATASAILLLTIMPFYTRQENIIDPEPITLPQDIYQYHDMEQHNAKTLAPIGKMKGEIDGKFESFYIAIDNQGTVFINRDPLYGSERFLKANGWEAITIEQLREYEKKLHFIPHSKKGLTP